MNLIKRLVMGVTGILLVIGGARFFVLETHWILDLLLGGAMATGVGLIFKALVSGDEKS